eukprot:466459_1
MKGTQSKYDFDKLRTDHAKCSKIISEIYDNEGSNNNKKELYEEQEMKIFDELKAINNVKKTTQSNETHNENKKLMEETNRLQDKYNKQTSTVDEYKRQINQLKSNNAKQTVQIGELRESNNNKEEQIKKLKAQMIKLMDAKNRLQDKYNKQTSRIDEYTKQLQNNKLKKAFLYKRAQPKQFFNNSID